MTGEMMSIQTRRALEKRDHKIKVLEERLSDIEHIIRDGDALEERDQRIKSHEKMINDLVVRVEYLEAAPVESLDHEAVEAEVRRLKLRNEQLKEAHESWRECKAELEKIRERSCPMVAGVSSLCFGCEYFGLPDAKSEPCSKCRLYGPSNYKKETS